MHINVSGTILVPEQDREKAEARFQVDASDRRLGGSIPTEMTLPLAAQSQGHTESPMTTNTPFTGKLGELGQPVIHRRSPNQPRGSSRRKFIARRK